MSKEGCEIRKSNSGPLAARPRTNRLCHPCSLLLAIIPEAHLFLSSLIDPRQVITFKVHTYGWGVFINSLLEKAFPVASDVIHLIKHIGSVPWGVS